MKIIFKQDKKAKSEAEIAEKYDMGVFHMNWPGSYPLELAKDSSKHVLPWSGTFYGIHINKFLNFWAAFQYVLLGKYQSFIMAGIANDMGYVAI